MINCARNNKHEVIYIYIALFDISFHIEGFDFDSYKRSN